MLVCKTRSNMSGAAGLLRAAQQLQQRAERRRGAEAVALYQQAVVRASVAQPTLPMSARSQVGVGGTMGLALEHHC